MKLTIESDALSATTLAAISSDLSTALGSASKPSGKDLIGAFKEGHVLGSGMTVTVTAPTGRRTRKAAKKVAAKTKAPRRARKVATKRSPEAIEALKTKLVGHIASHPSEGVEAIGKALGVSTKEIALPMKALVKSGSLKTTGEKRATKYTVTAKAAKALNGAAADAN